MTGVDHITGGTRQVLRAGAVLDVADAAQARAAFFSVAGHELRQPLQTLGLLNDILRRNASGVDVAALLERQAGALWMLRVLLDAAFDFGKAEAGAMYAESDEFAAGDAFVEVARELATEAARRGVRLDVIPCSARVSADPVLLRRLVETLAAAAIGHNGATRLLLGCRRRRDDVRLEVWYAGAGVAPDLFAAMVQGPALAGAGRDLKGLAVGLTAARAFAQLLDAPLDACSVPGRGGMFAVTLQRAVGTRAREGTGRQGAL